MTITLETGDKKGVYLSVRDPKGVVSEFMLPAYTLDFLYPLLISAMMSGITLEGEIPKLIPPCQK